MLKWTAWSSRPDPQDSAQRSKDDSGIGSVNSGSGSQRSIRFDSHSLDDSNFTFDSIDASGVQEQTEKAETRLSISMDAIAEFRVGTSVYTAEQGPRQ